MLKKHFVPQFALLFSLLTGSFPMGGVVSYAQTWPVQVLGDDLVGAWTRAGDFDLDGDPDIMIQNGDTLFWYENLRPGWTAHIIDSLFFDSEYAIVEEFDMDLDGDLDIFQAAANSTPGTLAWDENQSGGTTWERHFISSGVDAPAFMQGSHGDLDGDNDVDLVVPDFGTGRLLWLENMNDGTVWTEHETTSLSYLVWSSVADIDDDGDLDILGGAYFDGIYWFENQLPDSVWLRHDISSLAETGVGQGIDIDEDGDADVVVSSPTSLVYFDNPTWQEVTIADGMSDLILGTIGDVNGDNQIDVTYGGNGFAEGNVGWVENLGATWERHDIDAPTTVQRFPTGLADFDGDGDVDILGLTFSSTTFLGDARWYANPIVTSIAQAGSTDVPDNFQLHQNYPNPFNPVTTIRFSLPHSAVVSIRIFNLLGEEVASILSGTQEAGNYSLQWDATGLTSGVYFCRLETTDFVQTRRMILLR